MGRSRGGLTSKWHIAVDTHGRPLRFILTAGQKHDAPQAVALMEGLAARHVIADRAYGAHAIFDHIEATGAKPIIPQKTGMSRPRAFNPVIYKQRNRIERTIGKLKQPRRIATRYDRIPANYLAGLYLASVRFWA